MWGRLATCAAVGYRRRSTAKAAGADCQSAAGYQPAPQNLVGQPTPAQFFMGFRGPKAHSNRPQKPMVCPTRGSALLMVLWISAALAAVAFSLANTVRGETDRTSTELDEVRGYYLATGAVDRAMVELLWSVSSQGERKIKDGSAWVDYTFPTGVAHVELIPETAKLDVNSVPPERLMRLVTALGVAPAQAMEITQGIVARRSAAGGAPSLPAGPSFPAPGASLQEVEELLSVRGITPEIFYGTYVPAQGNPGPGAPRLIRRSGLVECLSVFGSKGQVDANTADPAVLAAIGLTPGGVQALLGQRRIAPLTPQSLGALAPLLGPGGQLLRLGGNSILTFRATARVRLANGQLSDMARTVAAQVSYMFSGHFSPPIHILRWYDTTWSN
jgi:general secretion pathway protein K